MRPETSEGDPHREHNPHWNPAPLGLWTGGLMSPHSSEGRFTSEGDPHMECLSISRGNSIFILSLLFLYKSWSAKTGHSVMCGRPSHPSHGFSPLRPVS